jgi:predicted cupin superfamily sugar epimerase
MGSGTTDEASRIIETFGMRPHPEGGYYVETWRDTPADGRRGVGTAIYYLLREGEISGWHRVDATEIWHWHAGAPLMLTLSQDGRPSQPHILGPAIAAGQRPQVIVPLYAWQTARSLGTWTLVGCTVSPAFDFAGFELAPPGWVPGMR